MDIERQIAIVLGNVEAGLLDTALVVAAYMYNELQTPQTFALVCRILSAQREHHAVYDFASRNKEMLLYEDVYIPYLRAIVALGKLHDCEEPTKKIDWPAPAAISRNSCIKCILALLENAQNKEKLLKQALVLDENNITALTMLRDILGDKAFHTCCFRHLSGETCNQSSPCSEISFSPFKNILKNFSVFDAKKFIDPYACQLLVKYLLAKRDFSRLFNLGIFMYKTYPTHLIAAYTTGMYFVAMKNPTEAKKHLLEASSFDTEKTTKYCWFLTAVGIIHSLHTECEDAISAYKSAFAIAPGNLEVQLLLGYEYKRTQKYNLASCYLTMAYKNEQTRITTCWLSAFVLLYGKDAEKENIIRMKFDPRDKYILVYYYTALQDINNAMIVLDECSRTWKYYAFSGLLAHMVEDYSEACEMYCTAMSLFTTKLLVLEDLFDLAISKSSGTEKMMSDYAKELFVMCLDQKITDPFLGIS